VVFGFVDEVIDADDKVRKELGALESPAFEAILED
jgi:hypothetical protein